MQSKQRGAHSWPKALLRKAPTQTSLPQQNCIFTGIADLLGGLCGFLDSGFAYNIAYKPEVLYQQAKYEHSAAGIFLEKACVRRLAVLSHTDLLRGAQLCSSCVKVLKAVTSMLMYTKIMEAWIFKNTSELISFFECLCSSSSNIFKEISQLPPKLAGASCLPGVGLCSPN